MSRRARELTFIYLYQLTFRSEDSHERQARYRRAEMDTVSSSYFSRVVSGIGEHLDQIDDTFSPLLVNWTKERLPRIDLSILRLAVYELIYADDVPDSVAISEAVRLARKFSTDRSRSYINAVLGNLARTREAQGLGKPGKRVEVKNDG